MPNLPHIDLGLAKNYAIAKIKEAGVRRRAERLYQQLDMLQYLRQQARRELLAESRKHAITVKLTQVPSLGPIRSALAVALIQTRLACVPEGNSRMTGSGKTSEVGRVEHPSQLRARSKVSQSSLLWVRSRKRCE